jgi:hypothetical protein
MPTIAPSHELAGAKKTVKPPKPRAKKPKGPTALKAPSKPPIGPPRHDPPMDPPTG